MTFDEQAIKKAGQLYTKMQLEVEDTRCLEIEALAKEICIKSATRELNAGYAGSMSDDGVSSMIIEKFKTFLAGYHYYDYINNEAEAKSNPYSELLYTIERQLDPEYQKYLELKEKFEK